MTVFDPSAARQLEADTQSAEFVHSLIQTYTRMLPQRVDRILDALSASDVDRALDAALSLRVSSIMTGTTELAGIATHVADDLRLDDLPAARAQALLLPAASRRAHVELDDVLGGLGPTGGPSHGEDVAAAAQVSSDSIR